MTFHHTSEGVELVDGHKLRGRLHDGSGNLCDAEIDLNEFIGNDNGYFTWGGANFTHNDSARNVTFSFEGAAHQPVLRADLQDMEGNFHHRDINLSERVQNINGRFQYI